ncbi:hypothetical protein GLUCOINTEAF2_0202952 [Komagataeibacter intermedius AF2]|uniref:Uncharacterized protein n=1 Tax=Komagataeibacter intermedius AF2 TaxID=1458464 RepID=A0A0N1F8T7_9PROT|nr:hypothetical protein GLUCOINTEAF2_0202952 [Komagataeibacter intermedius AF2]
MPLPGPVNASRARWQGTPPRGVRPSSGEADVQRPQIGLQTCILYRDQARFGL